MPFQTTTAWANYINCLCSDPPHPRFWPCKGSFEGNQTSISSLLHVPFHRSYIINPILETTFTPIFSSPYASRPYNQRITMDITEDTIKWLFVQHAMGFLYSALRSASPVALPTTNPTSLPLQWQYPFVFCMTMVSSSQTFCPGLDQMLFLVTTLDEEVFFAVLSLQPKTHLSHR